VRRRGEDEFRGVPFRRRTQLPAAAYEVPGSTFHVVLRAHPEVAAFSDGVRDAIWSATMEQLRADRIHLFAACLMPDHLHLVLAPRRLGVLDFVGRWKSQTTRLAWDAGYRGALWQPGMWDRTVRGPDDLRRVVDYVLSNPVVAELVTDIHEWRWVWSRAD
jgi:REP element-mobilizing transposase RayT